MIAAGNCACRFANWPPPNAGGSDLLPLAGRPLTQAVLTYSHSIVDGGFDEMS